MAASADDDLARAMRFHAVGNHATGGPTHFHAEEPAAVDWVNRWYKPLATQRQLMTALEGAPDGSFYVCNDKHADKVYHIVYKYQNQPYEEVVLHSANEGFHLENSDWHFGALAQLIEAYCDKNSDDLPVRLILPPASSTLPAPGASSSSNNRGAPATGGRGKPWTVEQVGVWLERRGRGDYVGLFAEYEIDGPRLVRLRDNDLRNIGVSSSSARRDLLRDIAELRHRLYGDDDDGANSHRGSQHGSHAPSMGEGSRKKTFKIMEQNGSVRIVDADSNTQVHELAPVLLSEINKALLAANSSAKVKSSSSRSGGHHYHKHTRRVIEDGDEESDEDLNEDRRMSGHDWYQLGVPRTRALALLDGMPDGSFVIRDSSDGRSQTLSYLHHGTIYSERILPNDDPVGFVLQNAPRLVFRSLEHLVRYFGAKKRPELPVRLRVTSSSQGFGGIYGESSRGNTMRGYSFYGPGEEHLTLQSQSRIAQAIRGGGSSYRYQDGSAARNYRTRSAGPPPPPSHSQYVQVSPSGSGSKQVIVAVPKGQAPPPGAIARVAPPQPYLAVAQQPQFEPQPQAEAGPRVVAVPRGSQPPPGAIARVSAPSGLQAAGSQPIAQRSQQPLPPGAGDRRSAHSNGSIAAVAVRRFPDEDPAYYSLPADNMPRPQEMSSNPVYDNARDGRPRSQYDRQKATFADQPPAPAPMPVPCTAQYSRPDMAEKRRPMSSVRQPAASAAANPPIARRSSASIAAANAPVLDDDDDDDQDFDDGIPFGRAPDHARKTSAMSVASTQAGGPRASVLGDASQEWLKMDYTRQMAEEELDGKDDGEFIVHLPESDRAMSELTFRFHGSCHHRNIIRLKDNQFCIEKTNRPFPSIPLLVGYYQSASQTDLPIQLVVIRTADC